VAMTTRNFENVDESVETMTKAAQDSTRIVTDYVVQAQELNTRLAQRLRDLDRPVPSAHRAGTDYDAAALR